MQILIITGTLVLFCLPLYASDGQEPVGEVGATKTNAAAAQKLSKMDPREIANLDALMAHALTLYYDREFALALPIFKELADKVETMDIMFWLGTSAAKTGENELAIEEFQKILEIDPALHRVRLEPSRAVTVPRRLTVGDRGSQVRYSMPFSRA